MGKGVVRTVRNNGGLVVQVHNRALVFQDQDISPVDIARTPGAVIPEQASRATSRTWHEAAGAPIEVDLHGLTVDAALVRVEQALDEACRADAGQLRLIHGKSGGRIRVAVHQLLRKVSSVRGFHLDPRNHGVTLVFL
jgi:DNA mismatch repair protein MutS2